MRGVLLGLLAAMALTAAPDAGQRSVEDCLRGCDASESETDRATCRITCEERQNAKEQPDIVKWERVELKGGSPDPTVERGSTTTVTEISPSGTKVTVTRERKPGIQPPPPTFTGVGLAYSHCQTRCESRGQFGERAVCRLRCAERELRRRRVRAPATPASTPRRAPAKPSRACASACVRKAATCREQCRGKDRATCELQCDAGLSACERRC